ncbi:hypothetical protein EXIGLDRAFT_726143 [Exidia glandulosa HHB12029]|uniref:Cupredoxin n=1 Tax=Exidia glandulosa HHB12029 TaxID=1314781 RepID=A0A165DV92_EXIGL|nr:hypothetical protein EXIGLDRAFT_726143 [Exidia glandulosa HHB12029]
MHAASLLFVYLLALFSTVFAVTHTVVVGGNGTLTFSPSQVFANEGDVIAYEFQSGTHSVVQSTFDNPCTAAPAANAVNSGLVTVDQALIDSGVRYPTYRLGVINASEPLWIMCSVPDHCMKGMVMVVNPSGNKTFDSFKTTALGLNTTALFDSSATALVPQSSLGKMLVGAMAVLAVSLAL